MEKKLKIHSKSNQWSKAKRKENGPASKVNQSNTTYYYTDALGRHVDLKYVLVDDT